MSDAKRLLAEFPDQPLEILRGLGGYYECPKDESGKRLGPLVGYAGRDEQGRQFVGDIYANFAVAEEHPVVLFHFARKLRDQELLDTHYTPHAFDVFCGAPMGGIAFGAMLALACGKRFVYPEKKVVEVATPTSRERSELRFVRHSLRRGGEVVIVEDVLNNFSTTGELCDLVRRAGNNPFMILGILNRSLTVENWFLQGSQVVEVRSLVRKPIPEYRQDDPLVRDDIAAGNVVWKPKDEWPRLMAAMEAASSKS